MKKILFALMAVAAIAMTGSFAGCKDKGEPNPDDNGRYVPPTLTGDTYYPDPHPAPIKYPVGE